MIDELGILPQSSIKRPRQSRATLVESAMKLPIRGTSVCRISHFHAPPLADTYACTVIKPSPSRGGLGGDGVARSTSPAGSAWPLKKSIA